MLRKNASGIGTAHLSFGPWGAGPWRVTISLKPADDLWSLLKASHDGRAATIVVDLPDVGLVRFDCTKVPSPAGASEPGGWIYTPSARSLDDDKDSG